MKNNNELLQWKKKSSLSTKMDLRILWSNQVTKGSLGVNGCSRGNMECLIKPSLKQDLWQKVYTARREIFQ